MMNNMKIYKIIIDIIKKFGKERKIIKLGSFFK